MAIATVNPTTGSTEMIIEPHSAEEVQDRVPPPVEPVVMGGAALAGAMAAFRSATPASEPVEVKRRVVLGLAGLAISAVLLVGLYFR